MPEYAAEALNSFYDVEGQPDEDTDTEMPDQPEAAESGDSNSPEATQALIVTDINTVIRPLTPVRDAPKPLPDIIDLDSLDEKSFFTGKVYTDSTTKAVKEEGNGEGEQQQQEPTATVPVGGPVPVPGSHASSAIVIKEELVDDLFGLGTHFRYHHRENPIDLTVDWNPCNVIENTCRSNGVPIQPMDLTGDEHLLQVEPPARVPRQETPTAFTRKAIKAEEALSETDRSNTARAENVVDVSNANTGNIGLEVQPTTVYNLDIPTRPSSPSTIGSFPEFEPLPFVGLSQVQIPTGASATVAVAAAGGGIMTTAEKLALVKERNKNLVRQNNGRSSALAAAWSRPRAADVTSNVVVANSPPDPVSESGPPVTTRGEDAEVISLGSTSFYERDENDEQLRAEYHRLKGKKRRSDVEDIEWRRIKQRYTHLEDRNSAVVETVDLEPEEEQPVSEDWDTGFDIAAKIAQRLSEKARGYRCGDTARKLRTTTEKKVKGNLAQQEVDIRAKIAKRKRKTKAPDSHEESKKTKDPQERKNGKPKPKPQARPSKPGKHKPSKEDKHKEDTFLRMISGLGHGRFSGENEEDTPNSNKRTARNHNREDALRDLIADIPEGAEKGAKAEVAKLRKACQSFDKGFVKAHNEKNGHWHIKGLTTTLRHHQLIGAGWMLQREKSNNNPRGGLLCDDMGFGKSLQSIAVIIAARAKVEMPQATLIVAPTSVVSEWLKQIEEHVDPRFRDQVLVYRAQNRVFGLDVEQTLESCFCVITTYEEVRRSMKTARCPNELVTPDQIRKWYANEGNVQLGVLHRIQWHRIIFDEAHVLKSYVSQTAHACYMLETNRRWLLTGSPLLNSIDEVYSYLLCLRSPLAGSRETFSANFTKTETSMIRMQKLLEGIMLRRNYQDKFMTKRIIKLPPHSRMTLYIDLSRTERKIYDIVQRNIVTNINAYIRAHRTGCYRHVLRMFTLNRQLTAHFMIGAETFRNVLTPDDRQEVLQILTSSECGSPDYNVVNELRKTFARAAAEFKGEKPPDASLNFLASGLFGLRDSTAREILGRISELGDADAGREVCKICASLLEGTVIKTSCNHFFCPECLEQQVNNDIVDEILESKCVECGEVFTSEYHTVQWKSPTVRKEEQKDYKENQDHGWILKGDTLIASSKLLAFKAQVQNWLEKDPQLKMIVYTQWIPVIKCLQRICRDEGWPFETYSGQQKVEDRDNAKTRFIKATGPVILIASLKAGGVGLNLTAATRLISLDLWFNYGVEAQAYHRIYRLGQERDTEVVRIVCRNTVDDKLIKMQEKKLTDIKKALGEDGSRKTMTLRELLSLFGTVADDENGDPFVIPDPEAYARGDLVGVFTGCERGEPIVHEVPDVEQEEER